MALDCAVVTDIALSCEARRRVGGVNTRIWRVSQLDGLSFTEDAAGNVDSLAFANTGQGLVTLQGLRESHSAGYSLVIGEGGTTGYQHVVSFKTIANTAENIATLQDHDVADGPFIIETNNREFFVYGISNGMFRAEGSQNSGNVATADTADTRTFNGEDVEMPKRFGIFVGGVYDYAATLALLVGYEV